MRRLGVVAVLLAAMAGCDEQPAIAPAEMPLSPAPDGPAWRRGNGSEMVATPPPDADPQLAAAITQARSTADQARRKWASTPAQARGSWAVNWAAPTVDGGVEYVWVRPTGWSQYRIEGWLANPPQAALACGRVQGELVSFPADELSDWARFAEDDPDHPVEGGFTIRLLDGRFGKPGR